MIRLLEEVKQVIQAERKRASDCYGETTNSNHETASFLLEEIEEAKEEMNLLWEKYTEFWHDVKTNQSSERLITDLQGVKRIATFAACECIQAAGLCEKGIVTVDKVKTKEE